MNIWLKRLFARYFHVDRRSSVRDCATTFTSFHPRFLLLKLYWFAAFSGLRQDGNLILQCDSFQNSFESAKYANLRLSINVVLLKKRGIVNDYTSKHCCCSEMSVTLNIIISIQKRYQIEDNF